jgi:hypothetical protein
VDAHPFACVASGLVATALDDLHATQQPPRSAAAVGSAHGWSVVVIVTPVKRSLARLRRLKLVSNSRRGQRGYFLPESSPIVRKAG